MVVNSALMAMSVDAVAAGIRALIARRWPEYVVDNVYRLTGGAKLQSWMIEGRAQGSSWDLVLRRSDSEEDSFGVGMLNLAGEARLLGTVARHGVAVPEVVYILERDDGLGAGFLMRRVYGETIPRKILRDKVFEGARAILPRQCAEILALIASVPVHRELGLKELDARGRLRRLKENYHTLGVRRPVFEYAFLWLEDRLPPSPAFLTLVHGDFRIGNLIIDKGGIAAVIDWELAHLGDPIEDLAWLCLPSWRFGNFEKEVGGLGTIDGLLESYRLAAGYRIEWATLQFWMALGSLSWGMTCIQFVAQFRHGDRTVERASIGRRLSEAELDFMMIAQQSEA